MDVEATVTNEPGGWRSPGAHFVIWPTGALPAIPYKHFQRCDLRRLHQMSFLSCHVVGLSAPLRVHFKGNEEPLPVCANEAGSVQSQRRKTPISNCAVTY